MGSNKRAALFVPLKGIWVHFASINRGREMMCYGTNSKLNIEDVAELRIKNIYFKQQPNPSLVAKADFINLTETQSDLERQQDKEDGDETIYDFYYRFRNFRWLNSPIALADLKHYKSQKVLRNDAPRVFTIIDPEVE